MSKVFRVCQDCGDDALLWDAVVEWDFDTQEMKLVTYYDADTAWCQSCEGECIVEEIPYSIPVAQEPNNVSG